MFNDQQTTINLGPYHLDFYVHLTTTLYQAINWQITEAADGLTATTQTFRCASGTTDGRDQLRVRIWHDGNQICWQSQARFFDPAVRIKGVKAVLGPVPAQRVIAPSGHYAEIGPHQALHYIYPFVASADPSPKAVPLVGIIPMPLVMLTDAEPERVSCLRARQLPPRITCFGITAVTGGVLLELFVEELAHCWSNEYESPVCSYETETSMDQILESEAHAIEASTGVVPFETRSDMPDWARRIALVVELSGMGYFGDTNFTFDQMRQRLTVLAERFDAEHSLVVLWGWGGRHDFDSPVRDPAEGLGGADEFRRLISEAQALGYRFILGGNIQGFGPARLDELGPRLAEDRITDRDGRPLGFYDDWDRDGVMEVCLHYVSPDSQAWRTLLLDNISHVVDEFAIDGYFLDQTFCFFSDPRHNHYRGVRELILELRRRHPQLLLVGESMQDYLMALTPFGTAGTGPINFGAADAPMTADAPLATRLYQRYVRCFGQLLLSPDGRFGVYPRGICTAPVDEANPKQVAPPESDPAIAATIQYNEFWLEAGVIPTLGLTNHTVSLDHPAVCRILDYAQRYRNTRL